MPLGMMLGKQSGLPSYVGASMAAGPANTGNTEPTRANLPAGTVEGDYALVFYANDAGGLNAQSPSRTFSVVSAYNNNGSTANSTDACWFMEITSGVISDGYIEVGDNGYAYIGGLIIVVFRGATYSATMAGARQYTSAATTSTLNITAGSGAWFVGFGFIDDAIVTPTYPADYTEDSGRLQIGSADSGGTMAYAVAPFETVPTNNQTFNWGSSDITVGIPTVLTIV